MQQLFRHMWLKMCVMLIFPQLFTANRKSRLDQTNHLQTFKCDEVGQVSQNLSTLTTNTEM